METFVVVGVGSGVAASYFCDCPKKRQGSGRRGNGVTTMQALEDRALSLHPGLLRVRSERCEKVQSFRRWKKGNAGFRRSDRGLLRLAVRRIYWQDCSRCLRDRLGSAYRAGRPRRNSADARGACF